jgi:DNA polymerase/3'-5' exonuclease PolX
MKPKDLATLNTKQEYTSSGHGLKNNVNKEFIATTEESKFLAPEGSKYLSLENSNSEQTI